MASPRPINHPTPGKNADKDESFWDKFGTLGRKKRIKEGETKKIVKLSVFHKKIEKLSCSFLLWSKYYF